jgi:ABC-type glycerol-3-phosphate transport system permease component
MTTHASARRKRRLTNALLYGILVLGAIPVLIPFFWMLSTSLKPQETAGEYPPRWLPIKESHYLTVNGKPEEVLLLLKASDGRAKVRYADGRSAFVPASALATARRIEPQWNHYVAILLPKSRSGDDDFLRFLLNTLVIAGMSVIGQILSSALAGWGFARLRFAGKNLLFMTMLGTMMIPGQVSLIPTFMLFRRLGWIDTFTPLILPAWFGGAFFIFLYRQMFLSIPVEMDEAAKVDGCSPIQTFWNILLPMAKPVTVTVGVFTFLGAWNDFLGPLIYINSDHKRTLSLALAKFQGAYTTDIPMTMAAATLISLPVLILYFVSQRALMQGMVVSGVKG